MKIETMTELQAVLDMKEWKLGLAAWIFSGHSPLQKKTSGTIVRITDNQVIQFGSVEYREAETAKNKIKEKLNQRVMDFLERNYVAAMAVYGAVMTFWTWIAFEEQSFTYVMAMSAFIVIALLIIHLTEPRE